MLTGIIAFLKAIPAIVAIVDKLIISWQAWRKNISDAEHVQKINAAMELLDRYNKVTQTYQAAISENANEQVLRELLFKRRRIFLEIHQTFVD